MSATADSQVAQPAPPPLLDTVERVPGFETLGILAFTTTRATGSFGTASDEPVRDVLGRWSTLRSALGTAGQRFATANQVHGARVIHHVPGWTGWLRGDAADGHLAGDGGTAMAVTVADCTPVFIAHPAGAMVLLHAGWRGTAAGILSVGVGALQSAGCDPRELALHLGPSICGECYEVGPEVHLALTGREVARPEPIDVRAVLADQAHGLGIRRISVSAQCTRCTPSRYFSHRGGDAGRQLGVMARVG